MAEEPDLPPKEATKKAMRQITGPVIAISLVLLSVFVPVGFIPGVSGSLFRQFAVTISVAMLISAINALTLVAGAVRRVPAPSRPAARTAAAGARRHRSLCATATPPWCNGCCASPSLSLALLIAARRAASGCWPRARPRVSCRRKTRARSSSRCSCRMAPRCPRTRAVAQQVERSAADRCRRCDGRAVDRRLLAARRRQRAECRVRGGAAEAVRRPHCRRGQRAGGDRARVRRGAAGPIGQCLPVQPAADHRPFDQRWIRIPVGEPGRPRPGRDGKRDAGPGRRGQPGPAADARLLHLHRHQPLALARHRPREGAGAGAQHRRRVQLRCSRRLAASTSTTSTCMAAPGR